jgi:hypothetical protein
MKQQMLFFSVHDMMKDKNWTADSLTPEQLTELKEAIIAQNDFNKKTKNDIIKATNYEVFIGIIRTKAPPLLNQKVHQKYELEITDLMNNAFERIFLSKPAITYVPNFKADDYGDQTNKQQFIADMCAKNPPIEFEMYKNNDCAGPPSSLSCAKN